MAEIGRGAKARRMTAAAAAETRTSPRVTRARVAPPLAPRSLLRQVRDSRHDTVHPDADRPGICLLDRVCQGIFLLDAAVSGHFPSGRSRVRAFSYRTRPDDACHGPCLSWLSRHGTSQQILGLH